MATNCHTVVAVANAGWSTSQAKIAITSPPEAMSASGETSFGRVRATSVIIKTTSMAVATARKKSALCTYSRKVVAMAAMATKMYGRGPWSGRPCPEWRNENNSTMCLMIALSTMFLSQSTANEARRIQPADASLSPECVEITVRYAIIANVQQTLGRCGYGAVPGNWTTG